MLRLVMKNISRRKFRSIVMIIAIVISVSLYVALDLTTNVAMISTLGAYTSYIGDFDILVYQDGYKLFNGTAATENISGIDGIDIIADRLLFGGSISSFININVVVVGMDLDSEAGLGSFDLLSGNLELKGNECILLDKLASLLNVRVGENISLFVPKANKTYSLVVSAIVKQEGKLPSDIINAIFVNLSVAREMLGTPDASNMLFIKLDPQRIDPLNPDTSIKFIVGVAEKIQYALGFNFIVAPIKAQILDKVEQGLMFQRIFLGSFASITVLMAIVLVLMISLMNLNDRIREIGILRAMGASRRKIFVIYLTETLILGIVGGILGMFCGMIIYSYLKSALIPKILLRYSKNIIISPFTLLYSLLMGIGIAVLGGLYPAVKASRMQPIEALQPSARRVKFLETIEKKISPEAVDSRYVLLGLGAFGSVSAILLMLPYISVTDNPVIVFVALFAFLFVVIISIIMVFVGLFPKIVKFLSKIFFFSGAANSIARGNILRHKHRSLALFFMLSLSVASIFTVNFILSTQMRSTEISMKLDAGAPIVIYAREPLPYNITKILDGIPGIESYCPVTYPYQAKVGDVVFWKSVSVNMYGIDPQKYVSSSYASEFGLKEDIFSKLETNDTVIISKGLAEYLSLQPGDSLRLSLRGKTVILKVVGVLSKAPGFSFTSFSSRAAKSDILVSINTYRNIFESDPYFSKILISVKLSLLIDQVVEDIQQQIGNRYDVQVISIRDYLSRAEQGLEALKTILTDLIIFAVLVAVLGEILGVLTTVRERSWEISLLRAMGASKSKVAMIFMLEATVISIAGYIVGFVVAYTVSLQISYLTNYLSEIPIMVEVSMDLIENIFLIVVLPVAVMAYIIAYLYSRKNIAQVLMKVERI